VADTVALAIAAALLLGNAFFVGAEFALISARRTQIEPRAEEGSRAAVLTLRAMERVSLMMAGAQLGITMCSLGLGAIAEPAVAHLLEVPLAAWGIEGALLHTISFIIAMTIVVSLHMVLGEMVPKNIAIAGPERSALVLGPLLYGTVLALKPVIVLLNLSANLVLRLLRVEPKDEVASVFTHDEVAAFIAESRDEGLLDEAEHDLMRGALDIGRERLAAVSVPRNDLVTLPLGATPADAEAACVRTGFSRFPVEAPDGRLVGYVHLKDLLMQPEHVVRRPIPRHRIRALARIPADAPLDDALAAMQARGTHVALVTGPDGSVVGAAMLEDVVERLIGEVADAAQAGTLGVVSRAGRPTVRRRPTPPPRD
jgi:CBS domain containing-hemolysin-like protein